MLDLGCGNGNGLGSLLTAVGSTGRVVALDRDAASLARAADRAGPLTTVEADITAPLPLDSQSVDAVICQNVVECVADRAGLLREIHRVLKPGGRALVGHHDFDGVLVASDDRALTGNWCTATPTMRSPGRMSRKAKWAACCPQLHRSLDRARQSRLGSLPIRCS